MEGSNGYVNMVSDIQFLSLNNTKIMILGGLTAVMAAARIFQNSNNAVNQTKNKRNRKA